MKQVHKNKDHTTENKKQKHINTNEQLWGYRKSKDKLLFIFIFVFYPYTEHFVSS